jgi:hypothetical protein
MNQALRFLAVCLFGMGGTLLLSDTAAGEPTDARLEKILADWQKRQHRFQTVQYEVRGERKLPKGTYDSFLAATRMGGSKNPVPPQNLSAPLSITLLLDFEKGRHRRENKDSTFHLDSGKLFPQVERDIFNGSVMKGHTPREENRLLGAKAPEMTIVSGNMKNGEFLSSYFPMFFAHGRIYTNMEPILPGRLRNKPDPDYLYLHGTGVHEGRVCSIVRTQTLKRTGSSFSEYWVDTARDSAIVRYLTYSDNKPMEDLTIRYRESPAGWLPESWRWNLYMMGHLLYSDNMRVEKMLANPPVKDADFEMEIRPGMIVEERTVHATQHPLTTPKSTISVYQAKEKSGREELPDPYHRKGDQYHEQLRRKNLWMWGWLGVPLMGIVGFLFWVYWFSENRNFAFGRLAKV